MNLKKDQNQNHSQLKKLELILLLKYNKINYLILINKFIQYQIFLQQELYKQLYQKFKKNKNMLRFKSIKLDLMIKLLSRRREKKKKLNYKSK